MVRSTWWTIAHKTIVTDMGVLLRIAEQMDNTANYMRYRHNKVFVIYFIIGVSYQCYAKVNRHDPTAIGGVG